jgi:hypothetical protein
MRSREEADAPRLGDFKGTEQQQQSVGTQLCLQGGEWHPKVSPLLTSTLGWIRISHGVFPPHLLPLTAQNQLTVTNGTSAKHPRRMVALVASSFSASIGWLGFPPAQRCVYLQVSFTGHRRRCRAFLLAHNIHLQLRTAMPRWSSKTNPTRLDQPASTASRHP